MFIDEEYFNSEEFQEVLESYEAAEAAGETPLMDADDLVDLADYYTWQGDEERASDIIEQGLQFYPGHALLNVFMARRALMDNNFDEAQHFADNITDTEAPDYHYLRAEILIAQGHIQEADKYLRDYALTVPADEYGDFVKDVANLYVDYDINEKAYEWMLRTTGDDSDDFKELMARTLFGVGKYKDSERIFNELIDNHPYSKHYWNSLASVQLMNEDYSNAITSSEYAIAIDPSDPDGFCSKASGLFRLGNFEEARKYYQRYTELVPDDEFGLLHQGVCLVNMGRNDEAKDILEHALSIAPDDSPFLLQIYQELAFCYSSLQQVDKALEMLKRTDTMDCDHIDAIVIKGHILLQNGLVEEAEEAFKDAIMQSDNAPGVLLRIIVSLYDNHYVNACYQMLLKFLEFVQAYYPDFHNGYAYMALCCYDLSKTKDFMKYLKLAVKENPQEAQNVLNCLFPEGTPVEEYVPYMEQRLPQNPK